MAIGDIRLINVNTTNGPNFEIEIGGNNLRYKVELASESRLLRADQFAHHTAQNYFSSGIVPSPVSGMLSWSVPPGVWPQLRTSLDSEGRVYCRVSILGAGVNVRNPPIGQEANAPVFTTSVSPEAIFFTGLDSEQVKDNEMAWNYIRIKATYPASGALPTSAQATLLSVATGEVLNVPLERDNSNSRVLVSEPVFLHGIDGDIQQTFTQIRVSYTDTLHCSLENKTKDLEIRDFHALPGATDPGGFRLSHNGPASVTIDPAQNQSSPVSVRMTGPGSVPIEGANIIWKIDGHIDSFISTTDENGVTNLEFLPDHKGKFSVLTDGLLLGEAVSRGQRTITAIPEENIYYSLLEQSPPQFSVHLVGPTTMAILQLGGEQYSNILTGDELYFEINLGDADMTGFSSLPVSLDATVRDVDGRILSVTLTREVYDYKFVSRTALILTTNSFHLNGTMVTFLYGNYQVQVPFYFTLEAVTAFEGKKVLQEFRPALSGALQSSSLTAEQRELITVRLQLNDNALSFLGNTATHPGFLAAIASKYLELINMPLEFLGQPVDVPANSLPLPSIVAHSTARYVRSVEQRELEAIFRHWIHVGTWSVFNGMFVFMLETVKFVLSPVIGAYVAISGKTIEGKKATLLERVLGGLDALTALIPVAIAISRYGRAAKAFRRKVGFDVRAENLKMGQAIEQSTFKVPAITSANALDELTQAFNVTTRLESKNLKIAFYSNRNIEKLQGTLRRHRNNLANKRGELDTLLQREINNGPSPELTEEIRWTRERINKLENVDIPNRQTELRHELRRNREATKALDDLYVGREMAREDLEFLRDEGLIPGAHDQFVGTPANRLYEFQLNEQLSMTNSPLSIATGWRSAAPRSVVVPYRPTRWGTRPNFHVGDPMRSLPRPDHLNIDPNDLRIGDSKYFTHWPDEALNPGTDLLRHEFIKDRIDQIVNTVEKGRLVQYTEVKALMAGQPPSAIWNEVFNKQFYIFTPVDVPQRVQNVIRSSVMGAGRNLHFITVPTDLNAWLRAI